MQSDLANLPDLAVFPDAREPLPGAAPGLDADALGGLSLALREFPAFATAPVRAGAAADAAAKARALAASAAAHAPAPAPPPPRSVAQEYFRVRSAPLSPVQARAQSLRVFADLLDELADAPLAGTDLERLGRAGVVLIACIGTDGPVSPHSATADPTPDRVSSDPDRWCRRWLVAHQAHALFCVYAAGAVRAALGALPGARAQASEELERAASLIEGASSARALALSFPAWFYVEILRPSMRPPQCPVPLSGKMHVEYEDLRATIEALWHALPDPPAELSRRAPELGVARERLLEAHLAEAERHIALIEPVVGTERSLIQPPNSRENAVGVLRRIRHRRAARLAPFLTFPDRLSVLAVERSERRERGPEEPERSLR